MKALFCLAGSHETIGVEMSNEYYLSELSQFFLCKHTYMPNFETILAHFARSSVTDAYFQSRLRERIQPTTFLAYTLLLHQMSIYHLATNALSSKHPPSRSCFTGRYLRRRTQSPRRPRRS